MSTCPDESSINDIPIESAARNFSRRTMMKRILITAVLALALAGTSAFAAQNKNAPKKPAAKPAAAAATNTGTMKAAPKKHKKRHHKKSGGTMTTMKKGNANKK